MGKELVECKYYRVMPISRITGYKTTDEDGPKMIMSCETLPLTEGVAIEERNNDGSYFVCAYVKPDFARHTPIFEDVQFRSITTLNPKNIEKLDEWLNCVDFAKNVIKDIISAKEVKDEH